MRNASTNNGSQLTIHLPDVYHKCTWLYHNYTCTISQIYLILTHKYMTYTTHIHDVYHHYTWYIPHTYLTYTTHIPDLYHTHTWLLLEIYLININIISDVTINIPDQYQTNTWWYHKYTWSILLIYLIISHIYQVSLIGEVGISILSDECLSKTLFWKFI